METNENLLLLKVSLSKSYPFILHNKKIALDLNPSVDQGVHMDCVMISIHPISVSQLRSSLSTSVSLFTQSNSFSIFYTSSPDLCMPLNHQVGQLSCNAILLPNSVLNLLQINIQWRCVKVHV